MSIEIPEFLLEMSKQMNEQDNRCTSHPFWQVRCKRYIVTEEGYNESHWELHKEDSEGWTVYSSKVGYNNESSINDLIEDQPTWCTQWIREMVEDGVLEDGDLFIDHFDFDEHESFGRDWPDGYKVVHMQETEEVVTTHLTLADAEWFIKRKQHDYPELYTYVESAYWSPQFKHLQDWIKSLT